MAIPLEIKAFPVDDEDEEERYVRQDESIGALSLHFQTLRTFFNLYMQDISNIQMAKLEEIIEIAYKEKGIDYDTKVEDMKEFPLVEDLYNVAIRLSDEFDKNKSSTEINEYKNVASMLRSMAIGADKILWNGKTNIDVNSDFVCLDTNDLQKSDERIQRTQYFNILTWAWDKVSTNRDEKILLIVDEAYLMVDPKVPQSLMFLRNVSKRIRKYEGGLGVISHSVVDFLHEEIRRYGQALMDNPTYKFMMGTDGKNLEELAKLYYLTEAEQELLNAKRRGHVLLTVGSKRVHSIVKLEPHEIKNFGKGGGR